MTSPTPPPARKPFAVPVDTNDLRAVDRKFEIATNSLRTDVAKLNRGWAKLSSRIDRYDELRIPERIIEMSGILDGLVRRARADVPVWNWHAMTAEETGAAWGLMLTWVREVFQQRWPTDYKRVIKPCWFKHPDVVELMSGLYISWRWAYEDEDGTPTRMAEWLDRWRPSLVNRMIAETSSMHLCTGDGHRDPWQYQSTWDDGELSAYLNEELQRVHQRDLQRAAQQEQQQPQS